MNSAGSLVPRFSSTTPFESIQRLASVWRMACVVVPRCAGRRAAERRERQIHSIYERSGWANDARILDHSKAEPMRRGILLAVLLSGNLASLCCAQAPPEKLSSMSIEDLLNVEVTSVSKTQQKISETAAAIYVITQEDIQRSGATNIPDLLRMVPGMDVAQINSNTWAISARGFNGRYSRRASRDGGWPLGLLAHVSAECTGTCWTFRSRISKESK